MNRKTTVSVYATDCDATVSIANFFFFQAEDGIRDVAVTGVQTCALPISYASATQQAGQQREGAAPHRYADRLRLGSQLLRHQCPGPADRRFRLPRSLPDKIGRASCRERV